MQHNTTTFFWLLKFFRSGFWLFQAFCRVHFIMNWIQFSDRIKQTKSVRTVILNVRLKIFVYFRITVKCSLHDNTASSISSRKATPTTDDQLHGVMWVGVKVIALHGQYNTILRIFCHIAIMSQKSAIFTRYYHKDPIGLILWNVWVVRSGLAWTI